MNKSLYINNEWVAGHGDPFKSVNPSDETVVWSGNGASEADVDTLGVRGGDIHSDREYMKISSLVERARLSTVILMKLASGEFDAIATKKLAMSTGV